MLKALILKRMGHIHMPKGMPVLQAARVLMLRVLRRLLHAEGEETFASGENSHAEGSRTIASGPNSHAEGIFTIASGQMSHAEGINTSAEGFTATHIMGRYGDAEEDYSWFIGNGSSSISRGLGAKWLASNGEMYIDGASYNTGGADFAEMFETIDGKEIEVGYFVTLVGNRIKKATSDDYILGITSATPSILGNSAGLNWHGRYQLDEWGRRQYQEVEVPEIKDKAGNILVPASIETQPLMNPLWDAQKNYIPREYRAEWVPVGLVGQVLLRDDGSCEVNNYCRPNDEGIATKSEEGFRVIKRTGANQILVLLKPNDGESRKFIRKVQDLENQNKANQNEILQLKEQLSKQNQLIQQLLDNRS